MAARRFSKTGSMAKAARGRRAKAAAPKPKGEPGEALGVLFVLAGIVLLIAGACMWLFEVHYAGEREPMILGGVFAGILGIASLTFYFHKWGKL